MGSAGLVQAEDGGVGDTSCLMRRNAVRHVGNPTATSRAGVHVLDSHGGAVGPQKPTGLVLQETDTEAR